METIVFNFNNSGLHLHLESFALRIGYLLSEKVISAGTSYISIEYEKLSKTNKPEEMLDRINDYHKAYSPDYDPKTDEQQRQVLKMHRKVKHHNQQTIVGYKLFEKALIKEFNRVNNEWLELHKRWGLPQLSPLVDGENMDIIACNMKSPESTLHNFMAVSHFMLLEDPEGDLPFVFILTPEFFLPEWIGNWKIMKADHAWAAKPENLYLQECFSLPNINLMEATELKTVRNELAPALAEFHAKTNEWLALIKDKPAESSRYFSKQLMNAAASVLPSLGDNVLLQQCSSLLKDKVMLDIYMGEAPLYALWDYFRHFKAIPDESWKKLEEARAAGLLAKKRVPIMVLNQNISSMPPAKEAAKDDELLPAKKSLSID